MFSDYNYIGLTLFLQCFLFGEIVTVIILLDIRFGGILLLKCGCKSLKNNNQVVNNRVIQNNYKHPYTFQSIFVILN